jgi:chemotaxis signal transduction protein
MKRFPGRAAASAPEGSMQKDEIKSAEAPANPTLSPYLIVQLNEDRYLISMEIVNRIIKPLEIFPMPDTPEFVLGVANCSGEVLPVVDLKKALHIPDLHGDGGRKFVICRYRQMKVGFVVDEVIDAWEIERDQIQADTTKVRECEFITGEIARGQEVLALIDIAKLIAAHQAAS